MFVLASTSLIQYTGRYEGTENVTYDWPGFHILAAFTGTTLQIVAQNQNMETYSYHNVFIDDELVGLLNATGAKAIYSFGKNLSNELHTVLITQRGEAGYGPTTFYGFYIDDDAHLEEPPPRSPRRLEIIGDSITVGGAMFGPCNETIPIHTDQDNYLTYGVLTANAVQAEYFVEAVSGIGMTHSYGRTGGMPDYYPRMQLEQPAPLWNFSDWVPDAVIIHLGTNDIFSAANASSIWLSTYVDFVNFIKAKYAPVQPTFFILCGSTIVPSIPWCPFAAKVASMIGGTFIDLSNSVNSTDIGCVGHPSPIGHQKMAAVVIPVVESVMHW